MNLLPLSFLNVSLLSFLLNVSLITPAAASIPPKMFGNDEILTTSSFGSNTNHSMSLMGVNSDPEFVIETVVGQHLPALPETYEDLERLYSCVLQPALLLHNDTPFDDISTDEPLLIYCDQLEDFISPPLRNDPSPSDFFKHAFQLFVQANSTDIVKLRLVIVALRKCGTDGLILKQLLEQINEPAVLFAILSYSDKDKKYLQDICMDLVKRVPIDSVDPEGNGILAVAIKKQFTRLCDWLLDNGAQVNVSNKDGVTPLHLAALHNMNSLYTRLIRLGANIYARCKLQRTIVHWAIVGGNYEFLVKIPQNELCALWRNDANGEDAFDICLEYGTPMMLSYLLSAIPINSYRASELLLKFKTSTRMHEDFTHWDDIHRETIIHLLQQQIR